MNFGNITVNNIITLVFLFLHYSTSCNFFVLVITLLFKVFIFSLVIAIIHAFLRRSGMRHNSSHRLSSSSQLLNVLFKRIGQQMPKLRVSYYLFTFSNPILLRFLLFCCCYFYDYKMIIKIYVHCTHWKLVTKCLSFFLIPLYSASLVWESLFV